LPVSALFSQSMVDIHCHILPGIDDGADSMETAVEMAEMAAADGITHIVGTPHSNDRYPFDPERIGELRAELQAKFVGRIQFASGCDFHLSYENLQDIRDKPTKYTINQKDYLLVELADYAIPPSMEQTLHQLHLAGLRPIITHPERNPLVKANPDRLHTWVNQGCYVQVTAGSLLGRFGPSAKLSAEKWLAEDCIHFIASDAHNTNSRPLKLREAFDLVAGYKGRPVAQALFVENPLAAFEGRQLPYIPDIHVGATLAAKPEEKTKRRKRFWIF
ncbi:MAG: tyrosine-protein phosphatase, partial [Candidatus Acidiferrales bacterium]